MYHHLYNLHCLSYAYLMPKVVSKEARVKFHILDDKRMSNSSQWSNSLCDSQIITVSSNVKIPTHVTAFYVNLLPEDSPPPLPPHPVLKIDRCITITKDNICFYMYSRGTNHCLHICHDTKNHCPFKVESVAIMFRGEIHNF